MTFVGRLALVSLLTAGVTPAISSVSFAATDPTPCGPGHQLTPEDHEQIIEAIVDDVAEVAHGVDYQQLTADNRANLILEATLDAKNVKSEVKLCIKQIFDTKPSENKDLDKEVVSVLQRVAKIETPDELNTILNDAVKMATTDRTRSIIEVALQIFKAGENQIYNSNLYSKIVKNFSNKIDADGTAIHMATGIAKRDVSAALVGGAFGFVLGPEGALGGAVIGGVKGSATAVLDQFTGLWFGEGSTS